MSVCAYASPGNEFPAVFALSVFGSFISYIYSAPPLKLKQVPWPFALATLAPPDQIGRASCQFSIREMVYAPDRVEHGGGLDGETDFPDPEARLKLPNFQY